ncbi:MAG TPA: hypothetical protein DIC42_05650 [Holosporales bacterium]|nr:hypothetical protein [Holosporales bacterium]
MKLFNMEVRCFLLGLVFLCTCVVLQAQQNEHEQEIDVRSRSGYFVGASLGMQMSGIKDEDFIAKNYSPLITISAGKWLNSLLALKLGYRGNYFNTISDDKKHFYKYLSGEAIFNLNALVNPEIKQENWKICFHAGTGYFYNHDYNRSNICAHMGLSGDYKLTERLTAGINVSAIMGWDIYQGDEDILPGTSIGINYAF